VRAPGGGRWHNLCQVPCLSTVSPTAGPVLADADGICTSPNASIPATPTAAIWILMYVPPIWCGWIARWIARLASIFPRDQAMISRSSLGFTSARRTPPFQTRCRPVPPSSPPSVYLRADLGQENVRRVG
jgi:hypothetical protein